MNFIKKRIRFCLLRTVLESLRGTRGAEVYEGNLWKVDDLDYNLIDCMDILCVIIIIFY